MRKCILLWGAALLAESRGDRPIRLGDYFGAVAGNGGRGRLFKAVAGIGAGELYAAEVFKVLRKGTYEKILDGEEVSLPSREGDL